MRYPVQTAALTCVAAAALLLGGSPASAQDVSPTPEPEPVREFVSDFSRIDAAEAAARAVAESSQSAQSAVTTRPVAPDPRAFAASAMNGQEPVRISAPGSEPITLTPGATTTSGATIIVPSTAQVRVPAGTEAYEVYDPAYGAYVVAPDYATSVQYETLIRAGRPPSYSITTLHGPLYSSYRPYSIKSPYIYRYGDSFRSQHYHDYAAFHRYNYHNRPFSSGLGYTRYDPLGGSLHRSAQLRFHEASRPRLHHVTTPTVRHDLRQDHRRTGGRNDHRIDGSRDRRPTRDAHPLRDSGRDRSPRATGGSGQRNDGGRYRRSPK